MAGMAAKPTQEIARKQGVAQLEVIDSEAQRGTSVVGHIALSHGSRTVQGTMNYMLSESYHLELLLSSPNTETWTSFGVQKGWSPFFVWLRECFLKSIRTGGDLFISNNITLLTLQDSSDVILCEMVKNHFAWDTVRSLGIAGCSLTDRKIRPSFEADTFQRCKLILLVRLPREFDRKLKMLSAIVGLTEDFSCHDFFCSFFFWNSPYHGDNFAFLHLVL